jgi:FRG domain
MAGQRGRRPDNGRGSQEPPDPNRMTKLESITEVIDCSKAAEFFGALQPRSTPRGSRPGLPSLLFRGHARDAWVLLPSSLRPGAFHKVFAAKSMFGRDPSLQRDQLANEVQVMVEFVSAADSIGLPIPDDSMAFREALVTGPHRLLQGADQSAEVIWPPRHFHAALALVRHSGLPTRLLDWTSDPMKAAYFAASEGAGWLTDSTTKIDGSDCLSVWTVDRARFVTLVHTGRNIGSRLDENVTVPVEFFSVPRASNPNAHAQSGWFSVVRSEHRLDEPVSRIALDIEIATVLSQGPRQPREPIFHKYTLPLSEAPRLLSLLAGYNINASSVFPDYHGAALAVKERRFYDRIDEADEL